MRLTLAAVGAVVAALLQATILPYLAVAGAVPNLVLLYVIVLAIVVGFDHGLAAAFVGGIVVDALTSRPLGSSAFVLLLAAGSAALIGRVIAQGRTLSVVIAAALLALVVPLVDLVVYGALRQPIPVSDPLAVVVPSVIYSTVVGAMLGAVASLVHRRFFERERIDW